MVVLDAEAMLVTAHPKNRHEPRPPMDKRISSPASLDSSLASHLVTWAAEQARLTSDVVQIS
jgi:hypothetical protein